MSDLYPYNMSSPISKARANTRKNNFVANDLSSIQKELREKRKTFLGSHISLRNLVISNFAINDDNVDELCTYLAKRSVHFWDNKSDETEQFCYHFYNIVIRGIASGKVGGESIDDIIQLADCLIKSKQVFVIVAKDILPKEMIGELFDFIDNSPKNYFCASFVDAVLGAISVLLGILKDPIIELDEHVEEA